VLQYRVIVCFESELAVSRSCVVSASSAQEAASLGLRRVTGGRYVESVAVRQIGARHAPCTIYLACMWTPQDGFCWVGRPVRRAW
jgi:hypothetical protein